MLYKKMLDPWLIITRSLRTFVKQTCPIEVTPTILLWLLPAQDSTHDLSNENQTANKTNPYCKKNLDTAYRRKHENKKTASTCITIVDELAFIYLRLPFGTTPAPAEYTNVSEFENRPRQRSTPGWILGHRWPKIATPILTTTGG